MWFVVGMTVNVRLQLVFQPECQATLITYKGSNTLMYGLHVSLQTDVMLKSFTTRIAFQQFRQSMAL